MAVLKKNIWFIFYTLTFVSTLLLASVSYLSWKNIFFEYQISQENIVKLITTSTHSLFKTQEIVLDLLGNRFLEDTTYKDNPKAMTTLNAALLGSPSIAAFALVTPEGKMTFASGVQDVSQFPNLLEQPESHDSFSAVLKSTTMMFGRTYYFKPLQEWIVPIRKSIRDDEGKIVTVITAALRVKDSFRFFGQNINEHGGHIISIVRDEDFYTQYLSNSEEENNTAYLAPIPRQEREAIRQAIFDTHHISLDEFRKDERLVSFLYKDFNNITHLYALKYDKTYKLWIGSHLPFENITRNFWEGFLIDCLLFIFMEVIFFFLFRLIANADAKRNAALIFQATHDQLTGLSNRSYLQTHIDEWLYKKAPPFSILYVDMDNFKNINDSFGHQCGDYLLVELANRLKKVTPKDAIVLRHGGDEFVIFTYLTGNNALLELSSHIIEVISQPYYIDKLSLNVGASVGIAKYPEHGDTLDMLLRASDIAMYESKKIKNSAHIFTNTMQEGYLKNVKIEQHLRKAIENNELFMVYQPQIERNGDIYGVEALVRWNCPELGCVPPDQFISVAETSGQMPKIGRFIIHRVLIDMKDVQERLGRDFQTSINISVRQFMDMGFLEHFLHTIELTQMSRISITLEVTENLFIEDINYILPLLHTLRDLDIKISMDDFGTGYSSLSMLRTLPIDELKIDKSFVDTIFEDEIAKKMVQNIITIGKNFNMSVLAEGVETIEQKEILSAFGCDRFQGYYFAKPLPKDELIAFFQR